MSTNNYFDLIMTIKNKGDFLTNYFLNKIIVFYRVLTRNKSTNLYYKKKNQFEENYKMIEEIF